MLSLKSEQIFLSKFHILFSIVKRKLGINFPSLSIDSKFGFLNVGHGLCILPKFEFVKRLGSTFKFSQIH